MEQNIDQIEQKQQQKIGLATATIVGMNAMIGSGIFSAPAAIASYVGPAGIVAYLLVVISVWFMAISLARLAELFPQEGSFYTYTKQWGGHVGGMIAICSYFTGLLIAMGLIAQMIGIYLHALIPSVSENVLGLATLSALVLLNLNGMVLSQLGQHILICTTVLPLFLITIMCLSKAQLSNLVPFAPFGLTNILKATRVAIFGFFGFECATSLFTIIENPKKNVPRALTYSIVIVGALYTLFVASLILSVPLVYFADPRVPLTETLKITFPDNPWLFKIVHLAILSAMIGTIHSMIWSASALFVSVAKKVRTKKAELFTSLPATTRQRIAVVIVGVCILTSFVTLKNIDLFFSLTALFLITAFILSMITLLTMKSEWKSKQNIKTIIGIITACVILYFALESLVLELSKI